MSRPPRGSHGLCAVRSSHAGAARLVTSLFKVPDEETGQLMKGFYEELMSGKGKLEALHTVQARRPGVPAQGEQGCGASVLLGELHPDRRGALARRASEA